MELATATQVFICSFFTMFVLLTYPSTCHEIEDEGEYNYDPWSKKGPAHWGDIRPEWYKCKNGSMQSPINLCDHRVQIVSNSGTLERNYGPTNATLMNTGHEIKLEWNGNAGYVLINGTQYLLQQCHWHSPSEHTINGIRFALELHMVHENADGRIAVIGVVYSIGRPDPFLSSLADDLRFISENKEAKRKVGVVDPKEIIKTITSQTPYYRYNGSLTTPPCSENVIWTVFREVKTVTWEQVRLLRVAVRDESYTNARPLQPINRRLVQLYVPEGPQET